jgi:hypothetical protein
MNYELKQISGIPHYINGTTAYTFELNGGVASDQCIPIGTYRPDANQVDYFPNWRELVQSHLDAFRGSLVSHARDAIRNAVVKPQKPRKAARNPRKSSRRAKDPESV